MFGRKLNLMKKFQILALPWYLTSQEIN